MIENIGKGLKPFVIQCMALLMGICYLANPLHQQIRTVFHAIVHVVESPENILAHPSHTTDHDHGVHDPSEHRLVAADHEHRVLDLMEALFDASDNQNPEDDTVLTLIKCDKHITSQDYPLPERFACYTSENPVALEQKVEIGYSDFLGEPPQHFFPSL